MSALLNISNIPVRQDDAGRFNLNDLHKSAGGETKHRPSIWLVNLHTRELIEVLSRNSGLAPVESIKGGNSPGTYVAKELVYAYAMWISPAFHLKVIRAYDAMSTHQQPGELSRLQLLEIALQAKQERLSASSSACILASVPQS